MLTKIESATKSGHYSHIAARSHTRTWEPLVLAAVKAVQPEDASGIQALIQSHHSLLQQRITISFILFRGGGSM
jgi:hypothetical protein